MKVRAREILQAHLKLKKMHVMVMFVCMNTENNDFIQCINVRAQHKRQLPVRLKGLRRYTIPI